MALPDTGTSRTIILRSLLDNAKIKYNTCGKEPIITANSSSLGCVGNVLLDIQIDRGKHLTIDALVVDDLSSNCLIAWKDMQRTGIISPLFPAKAHVTCTVPKIPDMGRKCTVPKSPDMGRKCNIPKSSDISRKTVSMPVKLNKHVISPNTVKQTVTASTADQSKGLCLKPNLKVDT
jgi:hypothetical protein